MHSKHIHANFNELIQYDQSFEALDASCILFINSHMCSLNGRHLRSNLWLISHKHAHFIYCCSFPRFTTGKTTYLLHIVSIRLFICRTSRC